MNRRMQERRRKFVHNAEDLDKNPNCGCGGASHIEDGTLCATVSGMHENWKLAGVIDLRRNRNICQCCGSKTRYEFHLRRGEERVLVGSECVKDYTDLCNPAFLHGQWNLLKEGGSWRVAPGSFYRQTDGVIWVIAPGKADSRWSLFVVRSWDDKRFYRHDATFPTPGKVRLFLAANYKKLKKRVDGVVTDLT